MLYPGLLSVNSDYLSIGIVFQFANFQTAEPGLSVGRYTVVVEQIPLSFIFYDGMVCSPAHNRSKDNALISERSVRIIASGVAQTMRITSGVGKIIFTVILMHPAGFEETAPVIARGQRFTVFIQND